MSTDVRAYLNAKMLIERIRTRATEYRTTYVAGTPAELTEAQKLIYVATLEAIADAFDEFAAETEDNVVLLTTDPAGSA